MPSLSPYRKPPRTPPGCENHLTRQQAAQLLGFSSEFKIRQLEREGRLQSVRGPMRTAFYARADVLAVKAELAQGSPDPASSDQETSGGWTDAELLLLLGSPTREGRPRRALDLVLETRISIERAEKVYAFWSSARGAEPTACTPPPAAPARASEPRAAIARGPRSGSPAPATASEAHTAKAPAAPASQPSVEPAPDVVSPAAVSPEAPVASRPAVDGAPPHTGPGVPRSAPVQVANPVPTSVSSEQGTHERRGEERLSRDGLIQQLRDPDPRVRNRAFALLKEFETDG